VADQTRIVLRALHATPKNIYLRGLPVPTPSAGTTIYLRTLHTNPKTIYLFNPLEEVDQGGGSFPTQYLGLRVYDGAVIDLCLVDVADAPTGDMPRLRKNGTTYAIYLVDTTDPDASTVRIRTNDGTKAVRLYT
jgi:hypothetical protein